MISFTDNGRKILAEAIEAQEGYYVDLYTTPDMEFNISTYSFHIHCTTHMHFSRARTVFSRFRSTRRTKRVENSSVKLPHLDIKMREESEREEKKPAKRR